MSQFTVIRNRTGNVIDSYIVTDDTINEKVEELTGHIDDYFNGINTDSYASAHRDDYVRYLKVYLSKAIMTNNLVKYLKYDNKVLFVHSFKDSRYDEIAERLEETGEKILYKENIAVHLYPIIVKMFNLDTEVHVACPSSSVNLFKYLMERYNVSFLDCNKVYKLGDDTWTLTNTDSIKFDMVLLGGSKTNDTENYFNASDIKDDFSSHCNSDFVLYDDYGDNELKRQCLIDDNVSTHYNLDARIRGDLYQQNRIEFSNWLATNLFPTDMVNDNQTETMIARLAAESRKLIRVY